MAVENYHITIKIDKKGDIQVVEFDGRPAAASSLSETALKIADFNVIGLVKTNPWCVMDPRTGKLWCAP